jgi:uncharacterized membrane protein required for colicin V production
MTTWFMVLLVLASVGAMGYRQGAIRAAFSFAGILVSAAAAALLGRFVAKLLVILGFSDPLTVWVIGPVIVFVIVSAIFKASAAGMHRRADVFYRHRAGDLRLALWERLNRRLGLCVGLLNGAAYLVLLAFMIYFGSYFTVQVTTSEQDPRWMRLMTRLGKDLHATGFARVARSIDSVSQTTYKIGDFMGLLYHNPLLQARLAHYPAFLALGETPDYQNLSEDQVFIKSWQAMDPIMTLLESPSLSTIRNKPEVLKTTWDTIAPVVDDARLHLLTGTSPKFDSERVLGRWAFDPTATLSLLRRARQNIPSTELAKIRAQVTIEYSKAMMVVMPDNTALLKNVPSATPGGAAQTLQGQWERKDGSYVFNFGGRQETATFEAGRLVLRREPMTLAFTREL